MTFVCRLRYADFERLHSCKHDKSGMLWAFEAVFTEPEDLLPNGAIAFHRAVRVQPLFDQYQAAFAIAKPDVRSSTKTS
jgi:hypothetical protein